MALRRHCHWTLHSVTFTYHVIVMNLMTASLTLTLPHNSIYTHFKSATYSLFFPFLFTHRSLPSIDYFAHSLPTPGPYSHISHHQYDRQTPEWEVYLDTEVVSDIDPLDDYYAPEVAMNEALRSILHATEDER